MIGPIVGSMCLGFVLGWLLRFFLERFTEFNYKVLSSCAAVLTGGIVVKLLPDAFGYWGWFYPAGLLLGIVGYPFLSAMERRVQSPKTSNRKAHAARREE